MGTCALKGISSSGNVLNLSEKVPSMCSLNMGISLAQEWCPRGTPLPGGASGVQNGVAGLGASGNVCNRCSSARKRFLVKKVLD